jgi:hypothetical protein
MVDGGANEEWVTTETRLFSCFGVVAEKVVVQYRVVGRDDREYEIRGVVHLRNIHTDDLKTSIEYALVSGASVLATDTEPGFATEHNKPRFKKFTLVAPARAVQDLGGCALRVTLTVVPD